MVRSVPYDLSCDILQYTDVSKANSHPRIEDNFDQFVISNNGNVNSTQVHILLSAVTHFSQMGLTFLYIFVSPF